MYIRMFAISALLASLPACGLIEEHKRNDGELVYRIKPEAAVNIAQAVGSVIPETAPQEIPNSHGQVAAQTTYSLEVTGRTPARQRRATITREAVAICFSPNDCLRVIDNGNGPVSGDFNGFSFILSSPHGERFFHESVGQEQVFGLAPIAIPEAKLASLTVKNLDGNVFQIRLRADNYPEYDIDAVVTFDARGELVSCVARRISTGERTVIQDLPPQST